MFEISSNKTRDYISYVMIAETHPTLCSSTVQSKHYGSFYSCTALESETVTLMPLFPSLKSIEDSFPQTRTINMLLSESFLKRKMLMGITQHMLQEAFLTQQEI